MVWGTIPVGGAADTQQRHGYMFDIYQLFHMVYRGFQVHQRWRRSSKDVNSLKYVHIDTPRLVFDTPFQIDSMQSSQSQSSDHRKTWQENQTAKRCRGRWCVYFGRRTSWNLNRYLSTRIVLPHIHHGVGVSTQVLLYTNVTNHIWSAEGGFGHQSRERLILEK